MRAIGYIRVSTEEQAKEGISLENQKRKITLYAEMNDMSLIDIIADEGLSAKDLNRPGVQRILEMAKRKETDCIIIYKLDRMFRSTIDALNTSKALNRQKVGLHSLSEKLDTRSAIGKFFFTLMASLAEMERNIISERTSDAMQEMKRRRQFTGNCPYGYKRTPDGKNIEPHKNEIEILDLVKRLDGEGLSTRQIASRLNFSGLQTRRGGEWRHVYIHKLLKTC